jgi:ferredoxin
VEFCPEVFRLNDRDVSEVHNPIGAPDDKTQEASDRRPVQGIPWE